MARFSLLPWPGQETHAHQVQLLLKALADTPTTMLFTNWRMVPLMALASRGIIGRLKAELAVIAGHLHQRVLRQRQVPPEPLTLIWSSFTDHIHASGDGHGHFPYGTFQFLLKPR